MAGQDDTAHASRFVRPFAWSATTLATVSRAKGDVIQLLDGAVELDTDQLETLVKQRDGHTPRADQRPVPVSASDPRLLVLRGLADGRAVALG